MGIYTFSGGLILSKELNNVLIKAYFQFKDYDNPPVPITEIKEYLEFEGVELEEIMEVKI
jgi:hypothetical protein